MNKKNQSNHSKKISQKFLKQDITKVFIKEPKTRFNAKSIIKKLRVANSTDSVNVALAELAKEGILMFVKDGLYRLEPKAKKMFAKDRSNSKSYVVLGKMDMTRSGAGYVVVEGQEQDIYVAAKNTMSAMSGDIVKVQVTIDKNRRKPEGKIISVEKRAISQLVGRVWLQKNFALIQTSYRSGIEQIFVNLDDLEDAKDKDYVLVEITDWSKSQNKGVWGKVLSVLEEHNNSEIAMNTILVNSGFKLSFPDEVLEESEAIEETFKDQEIAKRRDFRKVTTFTIDPDTAKDFDDALSYQELADGNIEIGVHIADVTHYLQPGTALDKEAYERSTSVYLVDRVIPMLPEKLSNNLCSLMPNTDRYTFSAVFTFNSEHKIISEWFGKGIIHSDKRFAYEDAQEILDAGDGLFFKELNTLNVIAHKMRKDRYKKGAIAFESEEVKFKLDENAKPISVYVKERKDTHLLIEDFMLLANKRVAKYIDTKAKGVEIPYIYRTHDEPNMEKLAEFAKFAHEMGFSMDISTPKNIARSIEKLAAAAKNDDGLKMLEPLAIRTMSKAEYSTDNIGHYGLAFEHYSHFTSPIRRYSDVIAHRLLMANLNGTLRMDKETLQNQCTHISEMERKAMKAERESIKFKQVEFLSDKIGQILPGKVSGFLDRGIFVELLESKAEGLVGFDQFNEPYEIAPSKLKAVAFRSRNEIKMGDTVNVEILETNLETIQIEMKIVM